MSRINAENAICIPTPRRAVCVCVHRCARGSQQRLIYTIFRCIIIIHDHLCSSLLPEMCETQTCSATYVLCAAHCWGKSASALYRTVGRRFDAAQIPPAVPTLPSEALVCFSWCNLLGSWQSCRALSASSKRHGLSPNVLWLEFWSFKIFLSHLFSPLSLPFLPLSLPSSLCFSLSVCVSRRITE